MHPIIKNFREIKDFKPLAIVSLGHGGTHWVNGIFIVLLPFIVQDWSLSYTTAGSMVSIFFIAAFTITIISGPIIDITQRFITAQFLCLLSGVVALFIMGNAENIYGLSIAAIFIGICVSGWHTPSIPYLSSIYEKNRGLALSIHTVGASLGDGIAPPLAGLILLYLTWEQTAIYLSFPVIIMAFYLLKGLKPLEQKESIDQISSKNNYWQGLKALISNRQMLILCLLAGLWSMTQNGVTVFLPLYLVGAMDASPALVGFSLFSIQLGAVFGGPIVGTWSDQVGRRPVIIYALIISAILLIFLTFIANIYLFILIISMAGCSLYSIRPVIHSWTMDISEINSSGSAVSMLFTAQAALTGIVPIVGGVIADIYSLKAVFYLLTLTSLSALSLAFIMPKISQKIVAKV